MRTLMLAALIAAVCAGSAAAQVADPPSYLVGTWRCSGDWSDIMTFTRGADGSLQMRDSHNTFVSSEGYVFDPSAGAWGMGTSLGFHATAGPWTARDWTFEGKTPQGRPMRVTYAYVDQNTFVRTQQDIALNGNWVARRVAHCQRED